MCHSRRQLAQQQAAAALLTQQMGSLAINPTVNPCQAQSKCQQRRCGRHGCQARQGCQNQSQMDITTNDACQAQSKCQQRRCARHGCQARHGCHSQRGCRSRRQPHPQFQVEAPTSISARQAQFAALITPASEEKVDEKAPLMTVRPSGALAAGDRPPSYYSTLQSEVEKHDLSSDDEDALEREHVAAVAAHLNDPVASHGAGSGHACTNCGHSQGVPWYAPWYAHRQGKYARKALGWHQKMCLLGGCWCRSPALAHRC